MGDARSIKGWHYLGFHRRALNYRREYTSLEEEFSRTAALLAAAAFQPCDHSLRRHHALRHLRLRDACRCR